MSDETLQQLIETLGLQPLPREGGLFRQTYQAAEKIPVDALPARYSSAHAFGTAIYYLLTDEPDSFSALHRLPTDEIYHFYLGDPVELLLLYPNGDGRLAALGPDLLGGQHVQFLVPQGVWQASRLQKGGRFALLGATMTPGFEEQDYIEGNRASLLRQYPEWAEWIDSLTR
jgi:uncharacterized protein